MKYKTKYIHLLLANELKFIPRVVRLFNTPDNDLHPEDHTFITPHKKVYEELMEYPNVELDTSGANLYTKYAPACSWIFSHGSLPRKQLMTTPRSVLRKVIYRYWGGSRVTSLKPDPGHPLQYVRDKCKIELFRLTYGSFAAIGVANITDVLDLSQLLKNTRFYRMPYTVPTGFDVADRLRNIPVVRKDGYLNILLGHRGNDEDNHIQLLETLHRFVGEKVRIYVPLSYGNEAYIAQVKAYIAQLGWDAVIPIYSFMEYTKYIEFLHDVDVGIFDGTTSYALGNIAILLTLGKTIYINRSGIIKQAFDQIGLPCKCIDALESESFAQLSTLIDYSPYRGNELELRDLNTQLNDWRKILSDFN